MTGPRSHWSSLFVWSWIWWHWDRDSSTINHTLYGRNTGLSYIFWFWLLLGCFKSHSFLISVSIWYQKLLNLFSFCRSLIDVLFFLLIYSCTILLPGFICACTIGLAWYAYTNPLHNVVAWTNLLFRSNLAPPWSLQVTIFFPCQFDFSKLKSFSLLMKEFHMGCTVMKIM